MVHAGKRTTKTEVALARFSTAIRHTPGKVYRNLELRAVIKTLRRAGHVPTWLSDIKIISSALDRGVLERVPVLGTLNDAPALLTHGAVTDYHLALAIARKGHFSHRTAAYLHGLVQTDDRRMYVNREQSPKDKGDPPTQESIDRAFRNNPRVTRRIYEFRDRELHVIAGKATSNVGVARVRIPGGPVPISGIERTLIELAVRPQYAGTLHDRIEAFKRARRLVTISRLVDCLRALDYVYPYHQLVGWYMEQAGYSRMSLNPLKKMGLEFDFYAEHAMRQTAYDRNWRIHHPPIE